MTVVDLLWSQQRLKKQRQPLVSGQVQTNLQMEIMRLRSLALAPSISRARARISGRSRGFFNTMRLTTVVGDNNLLADEEQGSIGAVATQCGLCAVWCSPRVCAGFLSAALLACFPFSTNLAGTSCCSCMEPLRPRPSILQFESFA